MSTPVEKRFLVFKDKFRRSLDDELQKFCDIGSGKIEKQVQYSFVGRHAKNLIKSAISSGVSAVPLIGPFAAGIVSEMPFQIYEYYVKKESKESSKSKNNDVVELGECLVSAIIEEIGNEIIRIYGYQILQLKDNTEVQKFADGAALKIIFGATSDSKRQFSFSTSDLLFCLTQEDKWNGGTVVSRNQDAKWKIYDVLTQTGQIGSKLVSSFGMRSPVLCWNESKKQYAVPNYDEMLNESAPSPLFPLVSQQEYDKYCELMSTDGASSVPFTEYFRQLYKWADANTVPVFRNICFPPTLVKQNLSHCDLSHAEFTSCKVSQCDFSSAVMILCTFTGCTLENVNFYRVDLRWSKMEECTLTSSVNFLQTELSYALIESSCIFEQNISFGSAVTQKANILCSINATSSASSKAKTFYNVQDGVHNFIGRSDLLQNIFTLFTSNPSGIHVIGGLGGMGKTQSAVQFASQYAKEYGRRVRWIAAENKSSLAACFREFAKKLGMEIDSSSTTNDEIVQWVRTELRDNVEHSLLIFDNAEDMLMIQPYLPFKTGEHFHNVLVTTRNIRAWSIHKLSGVETTALTEFSQAEAVQYIQLYCPSATEQEALTLAALFDRIPLGLSQCIGYIIINEVKVSDYITDYQKESSENNSERMVDAQISGVDTGYVRSIHTTIAMSVAKLLQRPFAWEILQSFSFLGAERIPDFFLDSIASGTDRKQVMSLICGYSLVNVRTENGVQFFSIHRLTQEVIRNMQTSEERERNCCQCLDILNTYLANGLDECDFDEVDEILHRGDIALNHAIVTLSYAEAFVAQSMLSKSLATLQRHVGDFYFTSYQLTLASQYYEESEKRLIVLHGETHLEIGINLHALGNVKRKLEKYDETMVLYEQALNIKIDAIGSNEHQSIAFTIHEIGNVHICLGNYDLAIKQFYTALDISHKLFGESHVRVAFELNAIGNCLLELGDTEKSLEMYQQSLTMKREYYKNDPSPHSTISDSIHNVGCAMMLLNQLDEAIVYFLEALEIDEKIYGSEHGEVAETLRELGRAYHRKKQFNNSTKFFERSIAMYKRFYPNGNAATYRVQLDFAKLLLEMRRFKEAGQQFAEVNKFALSREGSGVDYMVAESEFGFGNIHAELHHYPEALEHYQKALSIRQSIAGDDEGGDCQEEIDEIKKAMSRVETALASVTADLLHLDDFEEAMTIDVEAPTTVKMKTEEQHSPLRHSDAIQRLYNLRDATPTFEGREFSLVQLQNYFSQPKGGLLVIQGMPGVGKSELVLKYFGDQAVQDHCVRWIDCSTETALTESLFQLARNLHLMSMSMTPLDAVERILAKVARLSHCTLIFDGVTVLSPILIGAINDWNFSANHHIIVTTATRLNFEKTRKPDVVELQPLSDIEVHQLVLKYVNDATVEESLALGKLFNHLPQGLCQALAYIKHENDEDIRHYLDQHRSERKKKSRQGSVTPVATEQLDSYTAISMILQSIQNQEAIQLLKTLSFCHCDSIPESLVERFIVDREGRESAITELTKFSLVTRDNNGSVSVPLLVRASVLKWAEANQLSLLISTSELMLGAFDLDLHQNDLAILRHLISILEHFVLRTESSVEELVIMTKLHSRIGHFYLQMERPQTALQHFQLASTCANRLSPSVQLQSLDVMAVIGNIGDALAGLNKLQEALEFYISGVDKSVSLFGENHATAAEMSLKAGTICAKLSRFADAISYFTSAAEIFKKCGNRTEAAKTQYYVAEVHLLLGQFKVAEDLFNEVLAVFKNAHLQTADFVADVFVNLSKVCWSTERYSQALTHCDMALEIRLKIYDTAHIALADVFNAKGQMLRDTCQYHLALDCFKKEMDCVVLKFGDFDIGTVEAKTNLGEVYGLLDDHVRAIELFDESMQSVRSYFSDRCDVISRLLLLKSISYHAMGHYKNALYNIKEALSTNDSSSKRIVYSSNLVSGRNLTAKLLFQYGVVLNVTGNPTDAVKNVSQASELFAGVFGLEHSSVLLCQRQCASFITRQAEATSQMLEQQLAKLTRIFGDSHIVIADIMHVQAAQLLSVKQCTAALERLKVALSLKESLFGSSLHSSCARTLHLMGIASHHVFDNFMALLYLEEARCYFENLDVDHPSLSDIHVTCEKVMNVLNVRSAHSASQLVAKLRVCPVVRYPPKCDTVKSLIARIFRVATESEEQAEADERLRTQSTMEPRISLRAKLKQRVRERLFSK